VVGLAPQWRPYASAAVVAIVATGIVVCAPFCAPYGPNVPNYGARLQPPSATHIFGTDELGRDIFSRALYGTRLSLSAALEVEAAVVPVGVFTGLIAGYLGGWTDEAIMRITDVFLAFPSLLLAIAIVAALGPGLGNAVFAVSLTWWPVYARLTRGQVLAIKELDYVQAARAAGASEWRTMFVHVLRNGLSPIIVQFTIAIGQALVVIAGLSFLGFGARPPQAELGALVFAGFQYVLVAPWYSTFPGLAIVAVVLLFGGIGDRLQERLTRG
jgi:peptide/nickel transport system permease protein